MIREPGKFNTAVQVVLLKDFNVFDEKQLERAVSRSNVVINLLGMDKETMNFTFEDVHIEAAEKVATAASKNGLLERYLHVSCLAASPEHPSRRLRTKVPHSLPLSSCSPIFLQRSWVSGRQLLQKYSLNHESVSSMASPFLCLNKLCPTTCE